MEDLAGKVAVVTGAASGIGLGLARRAAAAGMKVVLADVERPVLEVAVDELTAAGADVRGVATDVSKGEQVEALADAALSAYGAVHLVCNNAGVGAGGMTWELSTADWEWVLGVNLWGVVHGLRVFVPILLEQGEGHVVNTASMAGLTSFPGMGPYNASKHAVVTISEALHAELAMSGAEVGVSVLCPGWVNTRILDADRNRPEGSAARPARPEQEAARAVFAQLLASGMEPDEVGDRVLAAVRERRFYVITHPEMLAAVQNRAQRIVAGDDPGMGWP